MAKQRTGFVDARSAYEGTGEAGHTIDGVYGLGSGEIDGSKTKSDVVAELAQPSATPRPGSE